MWTAKALVFWMVVAAATAQIPSLGWCPDYQAMANFNMNRFLGMWHEAERYFTVTELGSRCVTTSYDKLPDGRVFVYNEIKSALTGVKRVIEGQLQLVGRDGEGKLAVKYASLPLPYDTHYTILDTDYDTFAVMWSCSGIGPVHTQNAWVMTRDRLPPNLVLQRAYGVLDKYKISRAFFVKTNQEDCTIQPQVVEAIDPTPATPEKVPEPAAAAPDAREAEVELEAAEEKVEVDDKPEESPAVKSAILPVVGPIPVAQLIISNVELKKVVDVEIPAVEPENRIIKAIPVIENVENAEQVIVVSEIISEPKENEIPAPLLKSISDEKIDESQELIVESQPQPLKSLIEIEIPLAEPEKSPEEIIIPAVENSNKAD